MEVLRYTKSGIPVVGCNENGRNLYLHNCLACNKQFTSLGTASKYCDDCKNNGFDKIAPCNVCLSCGVEFVGSDGYQRYCEGCKTNNETNGSKHSKIIEAVINGDANKEKLKMSIEKEKDILKALVEERVKDIINKSRENGAILNNRYINYWNISGFNETIKNAVRQRDKNVCQVCGCNSNLEVHHVIPRKKGGNHGLDNLVLLCIKCHRAIETGDIEHAIRKCTKNAMIHGGYIKEDYDFIDEKIKLGILSEAIKKVFDELSDSTDEYSELLTYIDNTLEGLGL